MLNVTEALEILKKEQITSSAQVFRRWLRAGKVPGAEQKTLKEGWKIPEEGLQTFIVTQNNEKYKASYDRGYADAMKTVDDRDKHMLWLGMYYESFIIKRSETRDSIKEHFRDSKPFLAMADRLIFQWNRKSPKSSSEILILGNYFKLEDSVYSVECLNKVRGLNLEDKIMTFIMDYVGEAVTTERIELSEKFEAMNAKYHWDDWVMKEITAVSNEDGIRMIQDMTKTKKLSDATRLYKQIIELKEALELMQIWH